MKSLMLGQEDLLVRQAKQVYANGVQMIKSSREISIDCQQVDQIDSTGIAVLCAWWQYASVHEVVCEFKLSVTVQEMLLRHGIELP